MSSPGLVLVLVGFVILLALLVATIAFLPAYILWRVTKDKRYPMMWITCSAIIATMAATMSFFGGQHSPRPQPIKETLTGVADKSGTLRVTALRIPNPEQPQVRIEVDAENSGDQQQLLGIQCMTSIGSSDSTSLKQATTHYIWTVEPKWKGTLTCEAQLPGILYDGNVTVVLARCKSKTPGDDNWLPADSEAMYQNRFALLPQLTEENPK